MSEVADTGDKIPENTIEQESEKTVDIELASSRIAVFAKLRKRSKRVLFHSESRTGQKAN